MKLFKIIDNLLLDFIGVRKNDVFYLTTEWEPEMSDSNNQAAYAELFADIFYEQFISAYYVNLVDLTYVVYYRKKGLEKKYGNGENAAKAIKKFISEDVRPEDREQLKDLSSPEYVRERLKRESSFSFVVREMVTGKERYCKLQVTRGRDEDHMAICFLKYTEDFLQNTLKSGSISNQG